LARAPGRHVKLFAGLALAIAGDVRRAQELAAQLEQENRSNTVFKLHRLPTLQAAIALRRGNPERALTVLEAARPYELGQPSPMPLGTLFVPYLSGQAFLIEHNGKAAAVEFQKILDHPGIALNFPVGALARLQLARAQVTQGDIEAALSSYQEFLTLWKDADPDIPILRQARAEYVELR
jgi:eukaryotic-like serine/threonine-protein kinase